MNRRQFLVALGSTAAVHGVSAGNLAAQEGMPSDGAVVSLRSGSSMLDLFPGADGYGIALFTSINGTMERVAYSPYPVRMFYGTRTIESLVNVAFHHASKTRSGMTANAVFTDKRSNQWEVTFLAACTSNDGFLCSFDYRLIHGAAKDVFFEHSLTPHMPVSCEETYVLMPGLLYDGNRKTIPSSPKEIPQLTAAENFQVDTPIFTLSIPVAVFHEKRSGKTLMYLTETTTQLDMSGFCCVARGDDHRISIMAPCYREKHYLNHRYEPTTPKGATVSEGMRFSVPASYFAMVCPDIITLVAALQPIRQAVRPHFQRENKLPISEAAALVQDNFNKRMWAEGRENQFYINAMDPEYDLAESGVAGLLPVWQLSVGWGSGVITGYAMLKLGNDLSCNRSRIMLDRIAASGISPSGLFWSTYANGKWDPIFNNSLFNQHMRMPADATFYYLKAIALERSRGLWHPEWEKATISNLDAFAKLWIKHKDFGHKVDRNTLAIVVAGTAAGALCIGGLALGAKLLDTKEYLAVAQQASEAFYERYVRTGWIVGGPLDIPNAPDSESVTALLESYVTMYEVTKDRKYLQYAYDTAQHLSTWIVAYNATFPNGTFCEKVGLQTVGGVLANSQNHHIGPSFCTNSGSALLRLYQYTGETLPLHLLQDCISGLPQYVCSGKEPYKEMKPGMVSEQFSMSDEVRARGGTWEVCASWPATCVLLSAGEVPSVYVEQKTGVCAIFDQIDASFDAKSQRLRLSNPTTYPAKIRVQRSGGSDLNLVLTVGESKTVSLVST